MKLTSIKNQNKQEIAQTLSHVLADTYILYVKTQNFHWNIKDPRFFSLHLLFEKQYQELVEFIDVIAERIRTLGGKAPGSLRQFLELQSIKESEANLSGDAMIRELYEDHVFLADTLRPLIPEFQHVGDEGSADMLIQLLRSHEKSAWMLLSHLKK